MSLEAGSRYPPRSPDPTVLLETNSSPHRLASLEAGPRVRGMEWSELGLCSFCKTEAQSTSGRVKEKLDPRVSEVTARQPLCLTQA
jgi:hypothetical protein